MSFFSNWLRADVYKEPSTGLEFPETIDTYKRGKITPYEGEPGKGGVIIAYRSPGAEVSVFIRALGNDTNKTSEYFLTDSLGVIKAMEADGKYANVKIYNSKPEKEKPGWKSAMFTSSEPNRFVSSFIFCKVTATHLLKIRATLINNSNIESVMSFMQSLQEIMDKAASKP
jgi:hypothetical protein